MNYTSELYLWILNFLFVIGILLIPIGLGFMLIPDKIFKIAIRLNRWIVTDGFFNKLNKPVYRERFFYRHHKVFGIVVLIASVVCLYMLTVYIGIVSVTDNLIKLAESEFERWIFMVHGFFYLFIYRTHWLP